MYILGTMEIKGDSTWVKIYNRENDKSITYPLHVLHERYEIITTFTYGPTLYLLLKDLKGII